MRVVRRIMLGVAVVATMFTVAPSVAASAAPTAGPDAVAAAVVLAAPAGCDRGSFCVYRRGNGGDLCESWEGNSNNWGVCANRIGSMYNNGIAHTVDDVRVYWGRELSGAYICLPRGSYLLYLAQNTYNRAGHKGGDGAANGRTGLGEAVENNAASHAWAGNC